MQLLDDVTLVSSENQVDRLSQSKEIGEEDSAVFTRLNRDVTRKPREPGW